MIYEDFINMLRGMQEENFTGDKTTGYNPGCNDIPSGFQDINPVFFTMIGEILGAVMANKMPLNVQNAFGNWLELLGQVILTYSAQQQYFQAGPGRYYDTRNKNITNPFCPEASEQGAGSSPSSSESSEGTCNACNTQIDSLRKTVTDLMIEVECLKQELNNLKGFKTY